MRDKGGPACRVCKWDICQGSGCSDPGVGDVNDRCAESSIGCQNRLCPWNGMSGEGNNDSSWGVESRTVGHLSVDNWVYCKEATNPSQRVSTDCGNQSGRLIFGEESDGSDEGK